MGLSTATCFADLGNSVVGVDTDENKIERLRKGSLPIFEPGLEELVRRNVSAGRLKFTTSYEEGIADADFVFVAVNTPSGEEGEADLKYVRSAAEGIAKHLKKFTVVINKSTVPIGTGDWVRNIIRKANSTAKFAVVSNPEFLREGSAVLDFMQPDRVVLGSTDRMAAQKVADLYLPLKCPVIITDLRTAEMIKYASNAFLATRISFINEIASICDKMGADVKEVARGMGMDKRIGSAFLDAGIGYGGSCFPKDVKALAYMAAIHGCHPQLLRAVMEINRDQRRSIVQRMRELLGPLDGLTVGVLGLSFKPNTDDLREAPALEVIHLLQNEGARVRAYDPVSMGAAENVLRDVILCPDPYFVADGADAIVIATEWNEFKNLDKIKLRDAMAQPVILDGRNIYDPQEMAELGFIYYGVGRGKMAKPNRKKTRGRVKELKAV